MQLIASFVVDSSYSRDMATLRKYRRVACLWLCNPSHCEELMRIHFRIELKSTDKFYSKSSQEFGNVDVTAYNVLFYPRSHSCNF